MTNPERMLISTLDLISATTNCEKHKKKVTPQCGYKSLIFLYAAAPKRFTIIYKIRHFAEVERQV